jgi:hypothetical protein
MTKAAGFLALVSVLLAGLTAARAAETPLSEPCALDLRGVPLSQALPELATRLEVPYILDASVDEAAMGRPIRMSARHLSGEQAFRWLARLADLQAVLVDGTFLVATPDRLPAVWRVARDSTGAADTATRPQRIDLSWIDAPPSRVAADVAEHYGIDVVFHPDVLAEGGQRVHAERSQASVNDICAVLADQLGAQVELLDGAVWVHPATGAVPSRPASNPAPAGSVTSWAGRDPLLDRPLVVEASIGTWLALADRLGVAGGVRCAVSMPPGVPYPRIEARGTVGEVLEAGRLLGYLSWKLDEDPADGARILRLEARRGPQPGVP